MANFLEQTKILVVGATGSQGGAVARALLRRGLAAPHPERSWTCLRRARMMAPVDHGAPRAGRV